MNASKIIVVDDDDQFRDITASVLSHQIEETILSFGSCDDAWNHIETNNGVEVVLSDINMSGMNGLELLKRIKKRFPEKICIMMSGDPENEEAARKLGADAYIQKPFQARELFDLFKTVMAGADRH